MKRTLLVCASANQPDTVRGSSFDRQCYKCATRVMIAPSGQTALRKDPRILIICTRCFQTVPRKRVTIGNIPQSIEEVDQLIHELNNVIPNPWRKRN